MTDAPPDPDWDALAATAGQNPLALARLADRLAERNAARLQAAIPPSDDIAKARILSLQAMTLAPDDLEVAAITGSLMSESVPAWHSAIVIDRARNEAYDAALRAAIEPGMRVLEVGAGTGLLAMMAARAGASEVVTCEANPLIAERARTIVAANGFADRIRVVCKHSGDLKIGEDLSGPADVFVSEILSDQLLGEGMLPVVEDVVARLLKPGGAVIPYRGAVRIALGYYGGAAAMRMGEVDGFDVSAFNRILAPSYALPVADPLLSLSSHAADLFAFTFENGGPFADGRAQVTIRAKERANGIVQWIRIRTDRESYYENLPRTGEGSSWSAGFYPFAGNRIAEPGENVIVMGSHGRTTLRIWSPTS